MPIASVGMSCRFPGGASSVEGLWEICCNVKSAWSEIPKDRMNGETYWHPNTSNYGSFNVKGAHFLKEDTGLFDTPFFNISSNEASAMDPQQRLLLEATYEAVENAGIPLHKIAGQNVGVFVGGSMSDYQNFLNKDIESGPVYQATATTMSSSPTGDSIEALAIARSLAKDRPSEEPLYIGSVKSNIGHLEAGSGLAGIIKACLVLQNGLIPPNTNFEKENEELIPPNTNFEKENEEIPFESWKMKVPTKVTSWSSQGVRRASMSSFGFGGTNVHVILECGHELENLKCLNESSRQQQLSQSYSVMAGLKLVPDKPLPFWAADVRFSHSVRSIRSIGSGTASNTGARQVRGELQQATTVEEVNGIIGQALVMKISKLSMTPAEEIVPEKPLAACGLDFLVAIEMRNWLIGELEVDVPLLKLMNSPSLTALAVLISERSNLVGTSVQEANEG